MKQIGIVRHIDELGRIVLPAEMRAVLEIEPRDALEIFAEDGRVIIRKYAPSCVFCGSHDDLETFSGKSICAACRFALQDENRS